MQHNSKTFHRFLQLRHLIKCNPMDKPLLKDELRTNYYQQALNTLSDVRAHLSDKEEGHFFSKSAMRFFGNTMKDIKFSKRDMAIYCNNDHNVARYDICWSGDNLTLVHV